MSDRARWETRHRAKAGEAARAPSAWVMEIADSLPGGALVLDLAAGRGRHTAALTEFGARVVAADISLEALRSLRGDVPGALPVVADAAELPFAHRAFDAIVCVNFLDRALFPTLHRWLRPAGRLILETFTTAQLALGRGPHEREHLLEPDELPRLVGPLRVEAGYEGLVRDAAGERYAAGVAAVNAAGS